MPENVKNVEARAQQSFCKSVKVSNLNNVVVCLPYVFLNKRIKHCDKKDQNIFAAGHTVSSAARCSLSSLHSHCVHVGPTHSRDSFSVFLYFPLEVQKLRSKSPSACFLEELLLPSNHGPICSGVPDAFTHGHVTMEVCIRFLLSPWSLIKRAHPHSECRVTVTRRAGRSHAGKVRSRCATSQVGQESGRRVTDGIFKIKASLETPGGKRERGKK